MLILLNRVLVAIYICYGLPPLGAIFLSAPPPNLKSWIRPRILIDIVIPEYSEYCGCFSKQIYWARAVDV
jgi:hypothetical protein